MKTFLLIVGALAIIGGIGYVVYQQNSPNSAYVTNNLQQSTSGTTQETAPSANEKSSTSPGSYEDYSEAALNKANAGNVVLFFNASWCPDCRATVRDIEANLENIPEGLTILSVDYDRYADLKKKYGVTYQHTFVQVDESGNQLKKWSGSFTLDDIAAQVE